MTTTAREILRMEYGSAKNFMTPYRLQVGKLHRQIAFELSEGTGFAFSNEPAEPIYGLTVVRLRPDGTTKRSKLSECFHDREEVTERIDYLKSRFGKVTS